MKNLLLIMLIGLVITDFTRSEANPKISVKQISSMKLNAGIITANLKQTKDFYQRVLECGITFENEFYILMHAPDHQAQLALLLPDHSTQNQLFQPSFTGKGVFLTIEAADVDVEYKRIQNLRIPIEIPIRNEPWAIGILPLLTLMVLALTL